MYRETYQENDVYDQPLLTKVKSEIQKCWCDKQYEDLGKLGVKNMFDKQMIVFENRRYSVNIIYLT